MRTMITTLTCADLRLCPSSLASPKGVEDLRWPEPEALMKELHGRAYSPVDHDWLLPMSPGKMRHSRCLTMGQSDRAGERWLAAALLR